MKKGLYLILCLLLIPIIVNAKESIYVDYDVIVSDENSVELYDFDGEYVTTIPYDALLTITYEYSENSTLYGFTSYNEEYGYIDLSSTTLYSTFVDTSSYEQENSATLYVYNDGCIMFAGPSLMYEKLNIEIPIGTTLETNYYDDAWAYVEYNGTSGWIYVFYYEESTNIYDNLDESVAYVNTDNSEIIVIKENDLNIPVLTTIIYEYSIDNNYYVTYNGVSGWLKSVVTNFYNISFVTYDNVILYERDGYFSYNSIDIELPPNYEGEAQCWYESSDNYTYHVCKITYNEQTYYMLDKYDYNGYSDEQSAYVTKRDETYNIILNDDYNLYDVINGEVLTIIPAYTTLKVEYDTLLENDIYYYYVEYNGLSGWIETDNYFIEIDDEESLNVTDYDEEPEVDNESSVFSEILVAFIVALVISLTAIVLTIYINKKKDKGNVSN